MARTATPATGRGLQMTLLSGSLKRPTVAAQLLTSKRSSGEATVTGSAMANVVHTVASAAGPG